jgi:hypothetical protein
MLLRRRIAPLLVVAAFSAGTPAHAADPPDLWATLNICDTPGQPNVVGIRGSMPGLGKRAVLWMRFQVQYFARADQKWHNGEDDADSGWRRLGASGTKVIESGHSFKFAPPAGGGSHTLRGAVTFRWVRNGRRVKQLRRLTEAGHKSTKGADPEGYSAATCLIS